MLTGEFGSIALDDIHILPDRIRREVKDEDIGTLAESIKRRGLLHPIAIERYTNILIAGETRIRAFRRLGLDRIPYQYADELTEVDRLGIELEENVKRSDLSWQDRCDALLKYHRLHQAEAPGWKYDDTAEAVGYSVRSVQDQIRVAEKIAQGDTRVAAAKEYSVAKNLVQRIDARKAADELAILDGPAPSKPDTPILTADFVEWADDYAGPAFNFIHMDLPYGVNADGFNQGAAQAFGGYKDDFATYERLIEAFSRNANKLMGESCHVMFWFSMNHYHWTLQRLRDIGLWVDHVPLIWFKSDNTGALPDPTRGPRRVYETAFWCSFGDRKILQARANTFPAPVTRLGEHMSEKSQPMLEHFMRMVVDHDTRLLDPTCGSGAALRAADALGAGSVTGLELNPEFADNARRAWEKRNG